MLVFLAGWRYNGFRAEVYKNTMQSEQLLRALKRDFPELEFRAGERFKYRSPRTIYYEQLCDEAVQGGRAEAHGCSVAEQNWYNLQLLHEVGHGLLRHVDYGTDVERVKMERAAWEKARGVGEKYGVEYDEEFVEAELDTYREWLHRRSQCKKCGMTRYQTADGEYICAYCEEFGG